MAHHVSSNAVHLIAPFTSARTSVVRVAAALQARATATDQLSGTFRRPTSRPPSLLLAPRNLHRQAS